MGEPGSSEHGELVLNPRDKRKSLRQGRSYDGKPTLHAKGCRTLARTVEEKLVILPGWTLELFDRNEVWICRQCLVGKPLGS